MKKIIKKNRKRRKKKKRKSILYSILYKLQCETKTHSSRKKIERDRSAGVSVVRSVYLESTGDGDGHGHEIRQRAAATCGGEEQNARVMTDLT